MDKLKIGISSCLLGNKVRYDGNHKLDHYITETLGQFFQFIHLCPEVDCGLGIPREAMHLVGDPSSPHLLTIKTQIDLTERFCKWTDDKLVSLSSENLCGFIFKAKSPSCGLGDTKIYDDKNDSIRKSSGLFTNKFAKRFPLVPVIDDGRLHNQGLRENFIERVFVYARWQQYLKNKPECSDLIKFHQIHKLLIMAHSPQKQHALGKMVSNCGKDFSVRLQNEYIKELMKTLSLSATVKKNTNVLQHIAGYFKKKLSSDQKIELQEIIENYHRGQVPLIVPVTILKHYVRSFKEPYLMNQIYLAPHPMELMLRNHV